VAEVPKQADSTTIDLKDPALAGLLAWLIPGLGHWYQGRRAKAVLYFICIMGLFSYGVYLGGSNQPCLDGRGKIGYGRAVYFAWRHDDHNLWYLGQVGVGLPALPALIQANRMGNHERVWCGGFMAPPRLGNVPRDDPNFDQPTLNEINRVLNRYFELAGFFTVIAGLLNVLAIYDAWAGPVVVQATEKKDKRETTIA